MSLEDEVTRVLRPSRQRIEAHMARKWAVFLSELSDEQIAELPAIWEGIWRMIACVLDVAAEGPSPDASRNPQPLHEGRKREM